MKNSNSVSLTILHLINLLSCICLIVFSIISFIYLDKDIITYHEDLKDTVILFRFLISSLSLIGGIALIIAGLFPDKPYFLNDKQQKKVKRLTLVNLMITVFGDVGTFTVYNSIVHTKFIRRIWNWIASLVISVTIIFLSFFLFGLSIANTSIHYNLIELLNYCFESSVYNKLVVGILISYLVLTAFSILWRVLADEIRKNDENWRRQPIYTVILSLIIIFCIVFVSMYFNLSKLGIYILVIAVFIIGKKIEDKINPITEKNNKQRIFSNTPYDSELDNSESDDSKKLIFEDSKEKNE